MTLLQLSQAKQKTLLKIFSDFKKNGSGQRSPLKSASWTNFSNSKKVSSNSFYLIRRSIEYSFQHSRHILENQNLHQIYSSKKKYLFISNNVSNRFITLGLSSFTTFPDETATKIIYRKKRIKYSQFSHTDDTTNKIRNVGTYQSSSKMENQKGSNVEVSAYKKLNSLSLVTQPIYSLCFFPTGMKSRGSFVGKNLTPFSPSVLSQRTKIAEVSVLALVDLPFVSNLFSKRYKTVMLKTVEQPSMTNCTNQLRMLRKTSFCTTHGLAKHAKLVGNANYAISVLLTSLVQQALCTICTIEDGNDWNARQVMPVPHTLLFRGNKAEKVVIHTSSSRHGSLYSFREYGKRSKIVMMGQHPKIQLLTNKQKFTFFNHSTYLYWYTHIPILALHHQPASHASQDEFRWYSKPSFQSQIGQMVMKEHQRQQEIQDCHDGTAIPLHSPSQLAKQSKIVMRAWEAEMGQMVKSRNRIGRLQDKKEVGTPIFQKSLLPLLSDSDQVTFMTGLKRTLESLDPFQANTSQPDLHNSLCAQHYSHYSLREYSEYSKPSLQQCDLFPGQLVAYGATIAFSTSGDKDIATTESGQVLYIDSQQTTLRKAQTVLIYSQAIMTVLAGEWIKKGTPLMSLSYQKLVTGDIVQGLPKIEQFFEAPVLKDGNFWSESLQAKLNQFFQEQREKLPLAEAVRKGFLEIQRVLVEGVQRVYISQGVLIADKHLEVIVRQMTCKGRILYSGDTGFLRNELVSLDKIENVNQVTYGQKALYHPQVRGITDASLESESFLSAASFQETTRVLSRDAIVGKTDLMRGLKERVIVGELVQAGTGLANNNVYNLL